MIGERLKELRTARNLSLRDLAAQAGVSATLLSQVERSVTDPSLETVRRLAAVFGESITSLFAEPNAPAVWISRPGNRSKLTAPAGRVSYERLTAGQSDLEVLRAVLAPGQVSADEPRGHPSTECVYVIQGNWWRRSRASTIWSRAARASPSTRGSRTATATTHPGRWRSSCPSRRPVPESLPAPAPPVRDKRNRVHPYPVLEQRRADQPLGHTPPRSRLLDRQGTGARRRLL